MHSCRRKWSSSGLRCDGGSGDRFSSSLRLRTLDLDATHTLTIESTLEVQVRQELHDRRLLDGDLRRRLARTVRLRELEHLLNGLFETARDVRREHSDGSSTRVRPVAVPISIDTHR